MKRTGGRARTGCLGLGRPWPFLDGLGSYVSNALLHPAVVSAGGARVLPCCAVLAEEEADGRVLTSGHLPLLDGSIESEDSANDDEGCSYSSYFLAQSDAACIEDMLRPLGSLMREMVPQTPRCSR